MSRRIRRIVKTKKCQDILDWEDNLDTNFEVLPQKIPKIIHQIWIGPKEKPDKLMKTWEEKNPDFEYKFWNEDNLHEIGLECSDRINQIEEINGKCDIIRWEILYKYGGVFVDADSFCLENLNQTIMKREAFFGYENTKHKPGLLSTGTMGFIKNHPMIRNIIDHIKENEVSMRSTKKFAWETVGPVLLTKFYNLYHDKQSITLLPSYFFLPIYKLDKEYYQGHGKTYAHQEWGSSFNVYQGMNDKKIPESLLEPEEYHGVLVSSYNTKKEYIIECLRSIRDQEGYFGIELIWINDGSTLENSKELKLILNNFIKTTRFIKLKYLEWEENKGIAHSLNRGLELSDSEIIIKMDSDDTMIKDRIKIQTDYMKKNTDLVWLGGQCKLPEGQTNFKNMSLQEYKKSPKYWFCNHPASCYRKKEILKIGGYNEEYKCQFEDFELELRVLKNYGRLDNLPDILVNYRSHPDQVTKKKVENKIQKLNSIIQEIIFS